MASGPRRESGAPPGPPDLVPGGGLELGPVPGSGTPGRRQGPSARSLASLYGLLCLPGSRAPSPRSHRGAGPERALGQGEGLSGHAGE